MTRTINYDSLPSHMRGGMQRYIENRIEPGSFLGAILANDLVGSHGKADYINKEAIPAYVEFLTMEVPIICWGSRDKVRKWLERKED